MVNSKVSGEADQSALTGADPGFSVGGGARPPYDFAKFCKNLHEIEKILACREGGGAPGVPPKSATD